jgi:tetratricopeptide (TPR) repeat protein
VDIDETPEIAFAKVARGHDLLEGIDIRSEPFEDWLSLERSRLRAAADEVKTRQGDTGAPTAISSSDYRGDRTPLHFGGRQTTENVINLPLLLTETRSSRSGLESFMAEAIGSQLGRTATEHVRISVVALDGEPTTAVLAPGSRCTIRVTRNGKRMMALARLTREPMGQLYWSRQISFDASDELSAIDAAASLAIEATEAVAACVEEASDPAVANAMSSSALQDVFSFDLVRLKRADALLADAHMLDPLAPRPALRALSKAFLAVERSIDDIDHLRHEAESLIREALAVDANNALALGFIADVYDLVFEDPHMALSFAERALRLNPGTGYAHASLGGLELRRGRGPEALIAAGRARRQLENTSLQVFSNMRFCLAAMNTGDFTAAAEAAEKAAILAPTSRPPLRHLYVLRLRAGDQMGARNTLALLRRLEPDFSLRKLRDDPEYPAATIRSVGLDKLPDVEL